MRLTRKKLLSLAEQLVDRRVRAAGSRLQAAYLTGSLAFEEHPFLAGSTDIDLVFVHADPLPAREEVLALSETICADIRHRAAREYHPARALRSNAWLGPEIFEPVVLYDRDFFMERVQASLRAGYSQPQYTLARSRHLLDHGRGIWSDLTGEAGRDPAALAAYFKALLHAANALALLDNGRPLGARRFVPELESRAAGMGQMDLAESFRALLGNPPDAATLRGWLEDWEAACESAAAEDAALHPARRTYFRRGIEAWLEAGRVDAALWPLMVTWTQAAVRLPADAPERQSWQTACQRLGLLGDGLGRQVSALDTWFDALELLLEQIGRQYGLSE